MIRLLRAFLLVGSLHCADFSFIIGGDPHLNYQTALSPPYVTWTNQTQWIAANQSAKNIQAVLYVGDFYAFNNPGFATAWSNSGHGWIDVDGMGIPYGTAVGNHDYAGDSPMGRISTTFDAQLGYSRVSGKSWFGGYWNDVTYGSKANYYISFNYGSRKFLVVFLECFPRGAAVTWATGIIQANPDREAIVVTHATINGTDADPMYPDDDWIGYSYAYGPAYYGLAAYPTNYSGADLATWFNQFSNGRLLVAGHNDGYIRKTLTGTGGNTWYGIMTDYQLSIYPIQSEVVLLMEFTGNQVTVSNVHTNTGLVDNSIYPPDGPFTWAGLTSVPSTSISGAVTISGRVAVQ